MPSTTSASRRKRIVQTAHGLPNHDYVWYRAMLAIRHDYPTPSKLLCERFGISRSAGANRMRRLIEDGLVWKGRIDGHLRWIAIPTKDDHDYWKTRRELVAQGVPVDAFEEIKKFVVRLQDGRTRNGGGDRHTRRARLLANEYADWRENETGATYEVTPTLIGHAREAVKILHEECVDPLHYQQYIEWVAKQFENIRKRGGNQAFFGPSSLKSREWIDRFVKTQLGDYLVDFVEIEDRLETQSLRPGGDLHMTARMLDTWHTRVNTDTNPAPTTEEAAAREGQTALETFRLWKWWESQYTNMVPMYWTKAWAKPKHRSDQARHEAATAWIREEERLYSKGVPDAKTVLAGRK